MAIVLTYDVDKYHTPIKAHLIGTLGYQDHIDGVTYNTNTPGTSYLPNTTLYHPTKGKEQGFADIQAAAAAFGATLEKTITFLLPSPVQWRGL